MTKGDNGAQTRREFLEIISVAIAFGGVGAYPVAGLAAGPVDGEALKTGLRIEIGGKELFDIAERAARSATQGAGAVKHAQEDVRVLARSVEAISYALSRAGAEPRELAEEARAIARGNSRFSEATYRSLVSTLRRSGEYINPVIQTGSMAHTDYLESMDDAANGALLMASLAVRSDHTLLNMLPTSQTVTHSVRTALSALTANSKDAAGSLRGLVEQAAFKEIVRIPTDASVIALAENLPPVARRMVAELTRLDPSNKEQFEADVRKTIVGHAETVLAPAYGKFKQEASIAAGGVARIIESQVQIRLDKRELAAVAAIGSFVLSHAIKDEKTAKAVAKGVQLAEVGLQVAAAFATGGTTAVLGGIGALGGLMGPSGGGDPSLKMLQQIMQQIQTLKEEMHKRFDEVVSLQRYTISLLKEVNEKIDELQDEVYRLERWNLLGTRQDARLVFDGAFRSIRGQIAGQPAEDVGRHLRVMTEYALGSAKHVSYLGSGLGDASLSRQLKAVARVDRSLGFAGDSLSILHLPSRAAVEYNPIEFVRGAHAYLEAVTALPDAPLDKQLVQDLWAAGIKTRSVLVDLVTADDLYAAATLHDDLGQALVRFIKEASVLKEGALARFRVPVGAWGDHSIAPTTHKISVKDVPRPNAHRSWYAPYFNPEELRPAETNWTLVSRDPLAVGLRTGILKLEKARKKHGWIRWTENNVSWKAKWRELVISRDGVEIGRVFKAYTFKNGWPTVYVLPSGVQLNDFLKKLDDVIVRALEEKIGQWVVSWKQDGEIEESLEDYSDAAAAIGHIGTIAAWRLTNIPDDPWYGRVTASLPRSSDDIISAMLRLRREVTHADLPFLAKTLRSEEMASVKSALSEGAAAGSSGGTQAAAPRTLSWAKAGPSVDYLALVSNYLEAWVQTGSAGIRHLADELRRADAAQPRRSVDILDDVLSKLAAFMQYRGIKRV